MGEVGSVHVWGFFDDEGNRKLPNGVAPSDLSPYHHHNRVWNNVCHFGGDVQRLRVTRTLDGLVVGTEFETPGHDRTDPMWHVITRPSEPWPDPTRATTHPPAPRVRVPEPESEQEAGT